ncbi:MAG: LysE family transporter [Anaerolineae bacterium]|jgi:threonine/homoserine/homoserine lactone efflux protein|nr:LysE family transporter [Anaerolineae bacterium]
MLNFVTQGIGFGFAAGTSFGALHSLLMSVTLQQGWRQGLLIVLSPLLTDAPIIVLMLLIRERLPATVNQGIAIVGGIIVLWFAFLMWRQFWYYIPPKMEIDPQVNLSRETLLKGILVNFFNPAPYIFWGTFMGTLLLNALSLSVWHGAMFIISFYGTFLGIMALFVLFFDRIRGFDARVLRGLTLINALVMSILGIGLILQGISGNFGL